MRSTPEAPPKASPADRADTRARCGSPGRARGDGRWESLGVDCSDGPVSQPARCSGWARSRVRRRPPTTRCTCSIPTPLRAAVRTAAAAATPAGCTRRTATSPTPTPPISTGRTRTAAAMSWRARRSRRTRSACSSGRRRRSRDPASTCARCGCATRWRMPSSRRRTRRRRIAPPARSSRRRRGRRARLPSRSALSGCGSGSRFHGSFGCCSRSTRPRTCTPGSRLRADVASAASRSAPTPVSPPTTSLLRTARPRGPTSYASVSCRRAAPSRRSSAR